MGFELVSEFLGNFNTNSWLQFTNHCHTKTNVLVMILTGQSSAHRLAAMLQQPPTLLTAVLVFIIRTVLVQTTQKTPLLCVTQPLPGSGNFSGYSSCFEQICTVSSSLL
jgi:hypothetical protein